MEAPFWQREPQPHQRSTMSDQSALYQRCGQWFAPLNTVGFIPH
jgi:hypothetical protein